MTKDIMRSILSEILLNKTQLFRCQLCLALVAILFEPWHNISNNLTF